MIYRCINFIRLPLSYKITTISSLVYRVHSGVSICRDHRRNPRYRHSPPRQVEWNQAIYVCTNIPSSSQLTDVQYSWF